MTPPSFWFWLMPYGGDRQHAKYQHVLVALAEGLVARGAVVRANVDYWPLHARNSSGNVLFRRTEAAPETFDVVATSWLRLYHIDNLKRPAKLHPVFAPRHGSTGSSRRPFRVLIDWKYGQPDRAYWQRSLTHFDIIYRSHFSHSNVPAEAVRTGRIQVGGFHWTARMRSALDVARRQAEPWSERSRTLLWAHSGAALTHTVRRRAQPLGEQLAAAAGLRLQSGSRLGVAPRARADDFRRSPEYLREEAFWLNHTGGRHSLGYYAQLVSSMACDAGGGYFFPCQRFGDVAGTDATSAGGLRRGPRARRTCIYQWESFKLAEMMLAGCAVFMPDLERYQLRFAVMPTPFIDYVPYVLEQEELQTLLKWLASGGLDLQRIGRNGQRWAETHFSPLAFADRLLADVRKLTARKMDQA